MEISINQIQFKVKVFSKEQKVLNLKINLNIIFYQKEEV